jgi:hypothetical protein
MKNVATDNNDTSSKEIKIWRWPIWLGVASAIGLVSALIGDDVYDVLSWCLLGLPLIAILRAIRAAK